MQLANEDFLGSIGSPTGTNPVGNAQASCLRLDEVFSPPRPTHLPRDYHRPGLAIFLRPSAAYLIQVWVADSGLRIPRREHHNALARLALLASVWSFSAGTRILTRCPSTTPVGLALGPDLPRAD